MHQFKFRIYYEDTDLAGIVYYANYLKFIERARSEFIRELGIDQKSLRETDGIIFVVRRVEADFLKPAYYDDELIVQTKPKAVTGARLVLRQDVLRAGVMLFSALVTLVAVTDAGVAARMPANIRLLLRQTG